MRLPNFEYLEPGTLDEALEILHVHRGNCSVLAGGTDLLVRMKQRLLTPKHLISLKSLDHLNHIRQENGSSPSEKDEVTKIGARTPLADISRSDIIQKHFPGLFQAIESVGAPSIQHHRGTIGGNLCQDNRCLHYNQSAFWRSGRQACHKAGGNICYAKEGSDRCHATCQSDGAPMLMALDAKVTLLRKDGQRTLPLEDIYTLAGEHPLSMEPDEILADIQIPLPGLGTGNAYKKLAYRSAIDYPIASAGVVVQTSQEKNSEPVIEKSRIVVGAMSSAPMMLAQASKSLEGKSVSDQDALKKAAAIAMDHASAFATDNVGSELGYRIRMVAVLVRRALDEAIKRARSEA